MLQNSIKKGFPYGEPFQKRCFFLLFIMLELKDLIQ